MKHWRRVLVATAALIVIRLVGWFFVGYESGEWTQATLSAGLAFLAASQLYEKRETPLLVAGVLLIIATGVGMLTRIIAELSITA